MHSRFLGGYQLIAISQHSSCGHPFVHLKRALQELRARFPATHDFAVSFCVHNDVEVLMEAWS
jgi:hypothetical protein